MPYECNTSIRPGWFWKAGLDDQVKSLETLLDTWYASVGRSGNFLLNCPPDDRGRLPDVDVARLAEVGRVLKETFDEDLLRTAAEGPGVHFLASNVRGDDAERFGPIGLLEPGRESYWALDDDHTTGWVELRFEEPVTFDNVWLEEAIQLGQRITQWRVEAAVDDAWARVAEGTTLGARRVLRTPVTTTKKLRLYIDGAKACPTVSRLSLYLSPPRVELATPGGTSFERAELRAATRPGAVVRWTRDGSEPTASSPELPAGPVVLTDSATVALRAFEGRRGSPYVTRAEFQVLHASDALTPIHFVRAPDPGFTWRRYAGRFQSVAQFEGADPGASAPVLDAEGRAGEVSAAPLDDGPGALVFEGFLYARELGPWRVATTSDDGSRVWLGGRLVVDNDGLHGATRVEGTVVLAAGYYPVRIAYFDAGGGRALAFEAAPHR
ncbi:MAG: PA14 domain-containing protein [Planctomycetota bacterium]